MTIFFIIGLLAQPWMFLPIKGLINQFRAPQGVFLNLIFLGMICFCFLSGLKNFYRNKYLGYFLIYLLGCFFMQLFLPVAFASKVPVFLIYPTICVILGIFATYIALSYFEKDDYIKIARALCLSSSLIAVFGILQYLGYDPLYSIAHYRCVNRLSACLDNPNLVGNYLALTAPLFLYFNRRKYWLGYVLNGVCVWMTKAHFAYVLFGFSSLLYLFLRFRRIFKVRLIILLSILGASGVIYKFPQFLKFDSLLDGRLYCWAICLKTIKLNPLFGMGLGIFQTFKIETVGQGGVGNAIWFEAHCDPLQYIIEIGLVGVFLAMLVILNSIRNFTFKEEIGLPYFSMFITFLLCMCGSFPLEVPTLTLLGLISWWAVERL